MVAPQRSDFDLEATIEALRPKWPAEVGCVPGKSSDPHTLLATRIGSRIKHYEHSGSCSARAYKIAALVCTLTLFAGFVGLAITSTYISMPKWIKFGIGIPVPIVLGIISYKLSSIGTEIIERHRTVVTLQGLEEQGSSTMDVSEADLRYPDRRTRTDGNTMMRLMGLSDEPHPNLLHDRDGGASKAQRLAVLIDTYDLAGPATNLTTAAVLHGRDADERITRKGGVRQNMDKRLNRDSVAAYNERLMELQYRAGGEVGALGADLEIYNRFAVNDTTKGQMLCIRCQAEFQLRCVAILAPASILPPVTDEMGLHELSRSIKDTRTVMDAVDEQTINSHITEIQAAEAAARGNLVRLYLELHHDNPIVEAARQRLEGITAFSDLQELCRTLEATMAQEAYALRVIRDYIISRTARLTVACKGLEKMIAQYDPQKSFLDATARERASAFLDEMRRLKDDMLPHFQGDIDQFLEERARLTLQFRLEDGIRRAHLLAVNLETWGQTLWTSEIAALQQQLALHERQALSVLRERYFAQTNARVAQHRTLEERNTARIRCHHELGEALVAKMKESFATAVLGAIIHGEIVEATTEDGRDVAAVYLHGGARHVVRRRDYEKASLVRTWERELKDEKRDAFYLRTFIEGIPLTCLDIHVLEAHTDPFNFRALVPYFPRESNVGEKTRLSEVLPILQERVRAISAAFAAANLQATYDEATMLVRDTYDRMFASLNSYVTFDGRVSATSRLGTVFSSTTLEGVVGGRVHYKDSPAVRVEKRLRQRNYDRLVALDLKIYRTFVTVHIGSHLLFGALMIAGFFIKSKIGSSVVFGGAMVIELGVMACHSKVEGMMRRKKMFKMSEAIHNRGGIRHAPQSMAARECIDVAERYGLEGTDFTFAATIVDDKSGKPHARWPSAASREPRAYVPRHHLDTPITQASSFVKAIAEMDEIVRLTRESHARIKELQAADDIQRAADNIQREQAALVVSLRPLRAAVEERVVAQVMTICQEVPATEKARETQFQRIRAYYAYLSYEARLRLELPEELACERDLYLASCPVASELRQKIERRRYGERFCSRLMSEDLGSREVEEELKALFQVQAGFPRTEAALAAHKTETARLEAQLAVEMAAQKLRVERLHRAYGEIVKIRALALIREEDPDYETLRTLFANLDATQTQECQAALLDKVKTNPVLVSLYPLLTKQQRLEVKTFIEQNSREE
ncbi:MAG: hypothetical protein ACKVOH_05805 [Chlamydiales bacterium]